MLQVVEGRHDAELVVVGGVDQGELNDRPEQEPSDVHRAADNGHDRKVVTVGSGPRQRSAQRAQEKGEDHHSDGDDEDGSRRGCSVGGVVPRDRGGSGTGAGLVAGKDKKSDKVKDGVDHAEGADPLPRSWCVCGSFLWIVHGVLLDVLDEAFSDKLRIPFAFRAG